MNTINKDFSSALWNQYHSGRIPVIPDIKSRSPREGDLLQGRHPAELAKKLATAGARVISVVTEKEHFGGSREIIPRIVDSVSLPVLRKDFIISREQLMETAEMGASAVLLIAAILKKAQLYELIEYAHILGLEPLVETHNKDEIMSVNGLKLTMLGINNRNITELETDDGSVKTTEELAGLAGPEALLISESAVSSPADAQRAAKAGAHAVLVGTAILQARDPAQIYRNLNIMRGKGL
jgi:indole-3-glycerol phosphate synthase